MSRLLSGVRAVELVGPFGGVSARGLDYVAPSSRDAGFAAAFAWEANGEVVG